MQIIDAHHHLWNPISNDPDIGYAWLKNIGAPKPFGDPTAIQRDYLLDEFLAEPAPHQFTASVHVQADGAIPDPVKETRFVQSLSDQSGFPIAIVGFLDLTRDDAEETIIRHKQSSSFRGVRQILSRLENRPDISFAPVDYIRDKTWQKNFALLPKHDLSFDLQIYPEQMWDAATFLAEHPDVPVIIDHLGSPWDLSVEGLKRWRAGLENLAELPNISIKLSGFGMFKPDWNGADLQPLINDINSLFGFDRVLFASNFPVDKLMRSYSELLSDMLGFYADQPPASEQVFTGNARRIYRL